MRLNRAMIYVKDLARMTAFYSETLRLKIVEETRVDTWVEFDTGIARFSLHAIPSPLADECEISSPPRPRENVPVKLSFEVDDAAAERARLEALEVTIVQRPWGSWDVIDPEGNIFEIYSASKDE